MNDISQNIPADLCLASYRFALPEALIAQEPAAQREASRLLVLDRATGHLQTAMFSDILLHLPQNCLLIANNSRVIPARLLGKRPTGGQVEFLLLTPLPLLQPAKADSPHFTHTQSAIVEGLLRSSKKVKEGERIAFAPDISVEVLERGEFGRCRVQLFWEGSLTDILARCGSLPLPPYIKRPASAADAERYQTTYARTDKAGSVAAPTAGLHFTPALREAITQSGHEWAEVTLYVGYGTFSPVRCDDIRHHPMHAEYAELPQATANAIARAKAEGRPIIAVGTTSARTLEGIFIAQHGEDSKNTTPLTKAPENPNHLAPYAGWINIFLYPSKKFHIVDGLITNFHLPESSLLMLVSAFAGRDTLLNAYQHAIDEQFRFFSYGDAMLLV